MLGSENLKNSTEKDWNRISGENAADLENGGFPKNKSTDSLRASNQLISSKMRGSVAFQAGASNRQIDANRKSTVNLENNRQTYHDLFQKFLNENNRLPEDKKDGLDPADHLDSSFTQLNPKDTSKLSFLSNKVSPETDNIQITNLNQPTQPSALSESKTNPHVSLKIPTESEPKEKRGVSFAVVEGLGKSVQVESEKSVQRKSLSKKLMKSKRAASIFERKGEPTVDKPEYSYPPFIIPHRSRFKLVWDFFFQLVLLTVCLTLPVQISFFLESDYMSVPSLILYVVLLIFYWADIIIRLRTTRVTADFTEITDPRQIAKKYMKSVRFWCHLISSVPFLGFGYMFGSRSAHRSLMVTLFIRVFDLQLTSMENVIPFSMQRIWRLVITIVRFTFLIHWVTCVWYLLVTRIFVGDEIEKWVPTPFRALGDDSADQKFFDQGDAVYNYVFSAYSILMLMTGNDIIPTSTFQAGLSFVISIIGNMGLGYIFGNISFLIQKFNQDSTLYTEKVEALQRNLIQNQIPMKLRNRVFDYFDVYWQKRKQFILFSDFSELSEPLQRELAFHIHQDLVKNVPIFRELESIEIFSIIKKLHPLVYVPGDRIIREGDYGQEMFFINEGSVEVVVKKAQDTQPKVTVVLNKGDHFGEIALISNSRRTSDVNCIDFCVLEKFSKQEYLNLQDEFPDIKIRLRKGLKLFKEEQSNKIVDILKKISIFSTFSTEMIKELVKDYLEEKFVDPAEVILKPKKNANALYFIVLGTIKEVSADKEVTEYLGKTRRASEIKKPSLFNSEQGEYHPINIHCLDDEIETGISNILEGSDLEGKLLQSGDYFGDLLIDDAAAKKVKNYYITESGCQLLIFAQKTLDQIKERSPALYREMNSAIQTHFSSPPKNYEVNDGKPSIQIQQFQDLDTTPIRKSGSESYMTKLLTTAKNQSFDHEFVANNLLQLEKTVQVLKKQFGVEENL